MAMFNGAVIWDMHCNSSLGLCDKCRFRARWLPTLRPSQSNQCQSTGILLPSTLTIIIYSYYFGQKANTHFVIR